MGATWVTRRGIALRCHASRLRGTKAVVRLPPALLVALLAPVVGLADAWDDARRTYVEPLDAVLHRGYPAMIEARRLDVLLRMYATPTGSGLAWQDVAPAVPDAEEATLRWVGPGGQEPIRERYARLLELFPEVLGAELRIERVGWREPSPAGLPVTVHLLVWGMGPGGERRRLDQWADLRVRFFDPFWEITAEEITARSLVETERPRFGAVTREAGIESIHANELSPPFLLFGRDGETHVGQSSGVAVGDFDGDGCEDLLLAGSPRLDLYRNRCDGRFEDVTVAAGLPRPYPAAASGVVFFDYDNDGWPDLYVAAVAGGDRLFHNLGDGRFEDVTIRSGIPAGRWGSMPIVADYDRDGLLDVYVVRMGDHASRAPEPPYASSNGVRGTLLRNRGDGRFEDVTREAGVGSAGWDMAGAWGDYDGDGWPDLYVANEFGTNKLYRNEGDGTFTDRTRESGTEDGGSAMGATWGDYDADGDLDLFVSGMHSNSRWIMFHPDFPMPLPWHARIARLLFPERVRTVSHRITDQLSRGSTLFRNEGDGTFTDVSDEAGVRDGQWGWAAEFLDYDNDGRLDLYAVNGFVSGPIEDDL